MTIESRLSEFLLDNHRLSTGKSHGAHKLISFLVETHNAMLSEIGEDQMYVEYHYLLLMEHCYFLLSESMWVNFKHDISACF